MSSSQQVCKCFYAPPETTGIVNYNGPLSANHRSDPSKQELTFDLIIVITSWNLLKKNTTLLQCEGVGSATAPTYNSAAGTDSELQQPFLPASKRKEKNHSCPKQNRKNTDRRDRNCGIAVYISGPTILCHLCSFPSLYSPLNNNN